jgi:hypothetical protein
MKSNLLNIIFMIIGLMALNGSILYYITYPTFIALVPSIIGIVLIFYGIFARKI